MMVSAWKQSILGMPDFGFSLQSTCFLNTECDWKRNAKTQTKNLNFSKYSVPTLQPYCESGMKEKPLHIQCWCKIHV